MTLFSFFFLCQFILYFHVFFFFSFSYPFYRFFSCFLYSFLFFPLFFFSCLVFFLFFSFLSFVFFSFLVFLFLFFSFLHLEVKMHLTGYVDKIKITDRLVFIIFWNDLRCSPLIWKFCFSIFKRIYMNEETDINYGDKLLPTICNFSFSKQKWIFFYS